MTWKRVLTAAALIPVVVSAVWWGPTWLVAVLVAVVTVLALNDFFAVAEKAGVPGIPTWTIVCTVFTNLLSAFYRDIWAFAFQNVRWSDLIPHFVQDLFFWVASLSSFLFWVGVILLALVLRKRGLNPFAGIGTSLVGIIFVAQPLWVIVGLHVRSPKWVLFVLGVVWAGDTAAYFVGRAIGRHKLAPAISPGKTWEGAIANLATSLLVGYAFSRWIQFGMWHLMTAAGLASVAGQMGDLFESACKRAAGVKDSGTLLPGHGGMWDRIDALIFAAPTVWWYLAIMGS